MPRRAVDQYFTGREQPPLTCPLSDPADRSLVVSVHRLGENLGVQTVAPPGHQVDVTSCMAHTAGGTELRTWSGRSVGDDTQVHRHHFGEEVAHEQVSESRDRIGDSRSLGHLVWEVEEHTGQESLAGSQPD